MADFTGERVIPGEVDADLLNEHLARYVFAARLARGKRVLDAGCGAGYGCAELAKTALSVTGADSATAAIEYACGHYRLPNLHYLQASCVQLPHPNACFDLVVAFEVIEHLKNWREFLLEVQRVLVPSGQFIVSTPNKAYYADSRGAAGPNPFHEHEFEFDEFQNALAAIFPHISMFLENHGEAVVFQPVQPDATAEVRVDGREAQPEHSHFFVAVCAHRPQTGTPTFVYVPSAGNVLRDREKHIALLEGELRTKNEWLERSKQELADLNELYAKLQHELRERAEWGERLDREVKERSARVAQLQEELAREQQAALDVASKYEARLAELDELNVQKTLWAQDIERRMSEELAGRTAELARCVEMLHEAETAVEERTLWARRLEGEVRDLEDRIALMQASRWVRLGRRLGLGPGAPGR